MKSYRQINAKDRRKIARLKSYKLSVSEIARRTGFNKSTISRELKRNGAEFKEDVHFWASLYSDLGMAADAERLWKRPRINKFWSYSGRSADIAARWRRKSVDRSKRVPLATQKWIRKCLVTGWSPQQIAGSSKQQNGHSVSHEYIYNFVLKDKRAGGKLYRLLKRFGKRKQRLGTRTYSPKIPNRKSIEKRPKIVMQRKRVGDLEGDLIVGRHQSGYILSVVDRKTRLLALELLKTRKMAEVENGFLKAMAKMPEARTLTLDNAREFCCHENLTAKTGVKIYFADPYSSYQRGSVENANGLVRYYFPKKFDFSKITARKLQLVENKLNSRPRKVLGYLTAKQASATEVTSR